MADEPSYKSAVAAAEAQRIAAIEAVRARLAAPTALFDRIVERYMGRLQDCSAILRRADSAKPRFNAWDHNDKQRIYAVERAPKGRLIFRLLNPQINDGTEEYEFTSLQIFDPYHDPEKVGAPISVYPKWDFRPIGQRKSYGDGSDCFAVLIPWIQSYEFQISLRARLGEKLPPTRIEEIKRAAVSRILSDYKPDQRMAVFLDSQLGEAEEFCEHVLGAMLEYMSLTVERATQHLNSVPRASPRARRTRSFAGELVSIGAALFGILITIGPIALICYVVWSWLN